MSKQSIDIATLPLQESNPTPGKRRVMRVEVDYRKGGLSFATYKQVARGYYLSMRPVTIDEAGFESWTLFTGGCVLLETAPRFNGRRLQEWAHVIQADHRYHDLLETVLAAENLQLAA